MQKDFSGLEKLKKSLNKLSSTKIEYGFFPEAKYPDGDYVAEIANINEYGSSENPTRPFFEASYKAMVDRPTHPVNQLIKRNYINLVKGYGIKFDDIGDLLVEGVKFNIISLDDPPNSAETIERKGRNDPLVDSGLMRDSVEYKVVKG